LDFEDNDLLEHGFFFLDDSPSEEDSDSDEDEELDEDELDRLIMTSRELLCQRVGKLVYSPFVSGVAT
jgi:hypothetical protein